MGKGINMSHGQGYQRDTWARVSTCHMGKGINVSHGQGYQRATWARIDTYICYVLNIRTEQNRIFILFKHMQLITITKLQKCMDY